MQLLQDGRQIALQTTVSETLAAKRQLLTAYEQAQAADRLLAFGKVQESKRALIGAYLDAQSNAELTVFQQQANERVRVLTDAYAAKGKVDRLLRTARALRDESRQGGSSASATLALLLLKAELYASEPAPPSLAGKVDLRIDNLGPLQAADYAKDAAAVVVALEKQQTEIDATIATQTALVLKREGVALPPQPSQTELTAALAKQYPQLFQQDDLTALGQTLSTNNPLQSASQTVATDMLQLSGIDNLLQSAQTSGTQKLIDQLQSDLRALQAGVAQENARKQELTTARDVAQTSYTALARKAAEAGVASQLPGTEVRFAARAAVPAAPLPSILPLVAAAALGAALLLGLVLAWLVDFLLRRRGSLLAARQGRTSQPEAAS